MRFRQTLPRKGHALVDAKFSKQHAIVASALLAGVVALPFGGFLLGLAVSTEHLPARVFEAFEYADLSTRSLGFPVVPGGDAPTPHNAWPWIAVAWLGSALAFRPLFLRAAAPYRLLAGLVVAPLVFAFTLAWAASLEGGRESHFEPAAVARIAAFTYVLGAVLIAPWVPSWLKRGTIRPARMAVRATVATGVAVLILGTLLLMTGMFFASGPGLLILVVLGAGALAGAAFGVLARQPPVDDATGTPPA